MPVFVKEGLGSLKVQEKFHSKMIKISFGIIHLRNSVSHETFCIDAIQFSNFFLMVFLL